MSKRKSLYGIFNSLSIKNKLTVIIMGITAFALMMSIMVGITTNYIILRAEMHERLGVMADFSSKNLAASLDFFDKESADETLQALSYDDATEGACVYDSGGMLFTGFAIACPETLEADAHEESFNRLFIDTPIVMGGSRIGTLHLFYDLSEAHMNFMMNTMIDVVIAMVALTLAYIITSVVQGVISRPVTELASAAHKFVSHKDFSIRVKKTTEDELGHMVQAFNNMVREMEERDRMIRKAKEDAENASEEAKKASQMKSEFLANMSHELRTPLNSIIGLSRIMLEDAQLESEELEMTGTVFRSASTLLDIVNDILDLSKIESGQIILEKIGFDFKTVVASVTETLGPIASKKGVSLNYHYSKEGLPLVLGDPARVSRILTNLMGNAVKYTDQGNVNIIIDHKLILGTKVNQSTSILRHADKDSVSAFIDYDEVSKDRVMVMCSVVDTGIGIAEDKLDIIFEKFSQADESTTRKFGGTGLGLAITKELVEMMGGEIGVTSSVGQGSTFWFKIPFEVTDTVHDELKVSATAAPIKVNANRIEAAAAKILIAEDYELNQVFIKKLLNRLGFHGYDMVESGIDAFKAYKAKAYDLILMDCHMPDMNGYEATGKIRAAEKKTKTHVPIIALTADAMVGTREKCLEAGMDDYISKPIDSDEFKNLIGRWFVVSTGKGGNKKSNSLDDVIDMSSLKEYAETRDEMRGFCNLFFTKTEEELENLRKQCTDGVNENWTEIAHKIKGSAGMIGAFRLQGLCGKAQDMKVSALVERKKRLDEIQSAYKELKETLIKELG